jgi:hypothetical protein
MGNGSTMRSPVPASHAEPWKRPEVSLRGSAVPREMLLLFTYQPTGFPWFWRSSHSFSGAKYSSSAPASIVRSPVIA